MLYHCVFRKVMHQILSLSTLFYVAFCTFIVILALHAGNFKGASRTYFMLLNIIPTVGIITGVIFLILLWINTLWYVSIVVMLLGFALPFVLSRPLITFFGGGIMSPASMLLAPICAVMMFVFMPVKGATESVFAGKNYHKDESYKYEYRTGSSGNYSYNYDVVGEDENGNEVTGNVEIHSNAGEGTISDGNGDEKHVDVHWVDYGKMEALDENGEKYELEVAQ